MSAADMAHGRGVPVAHGYHRSLIILVKFEGNFTTEEEVPKVKAREAYSTQRVFSGYDFGFRRGVLLPDLQPLARALFP